VRILVAHSFYRIPGGEDRYVEQQVELLARRHTVELLGRHNRELRVGVPAAARMAYSRTDQHDVEDLVRRFRPDVIHLHNAYPSLGPAVHLAAERCAVPLVATVHNFRMRCPNGFMFTEGQACRRCEGGMYVHAVLHKCFPTRAQSGTYAAGLWLHRVLLKLEHKVALFITPSEFMKRRLIEWGFPADKLRVVRNFTDVRPATAEPGSYGVFVGRLSGEKGVDVLLRALRTAGDPPFRIVGDGPILEVLKRSAAQLGLVNCRFTGRLGPEEVAETLHSARYAVIPSQSEENAPLAALEAMSAGRPLICSAIGGLPELARNGEGRIFRAGDAEQLAEHIRALMADRDLCRSMGARALALARSEFSADTHLTRLEDAYGAVASHPGGAHESVSSRRRLRASA
jgi:glycosyltransferase involved in cell wall biosynthesis